jgi:hypothetical protein
MIGRRATVGLSLLCALMFCAIAVQSASAQVGTKSTNTTAVTCVKGAGNSDFSDAHCDKKVPNGTGEYGHLAIANGKTTQIEVTNEKTKNSTTEATTSVLKGTVFKVTTEITCKVATTAGAPKASWIENVESEGKHTVKGTVNILFKTCTVVKPAKCTIAEPIETVANFVGVEGLKPGGNEMGVEFSGENAKGNFASLTFGNDAECSLKNQNFEVSGTATATSGSGSQTNKNSGATSVYIPNKESAPVEAEEMQTLQIGGKPAYFTGTFTTKMSGGEDPIALTTTT